MYSYDLNDLLLIALEMDFPINCICSMIGIPKELLYRYQNNMSINQQELNKLEKLTMFLFDLYTQGTCDGLYMKDKIETLTEKYGFSKRAISNYLGISDEKLDIFLGSHDWDCNDYKIAMRLLHLILIIEKYGR